MIDNWPEAGAVVGAIGIIAGAAIKVFAGREKKDDANYQILLKNQADSTRILDRLSMIIEHRETRTEDLHKDTHAKLDEVTENQKDIHRAILEVGRSLERRAA